MRVDLPRYLSDQTQYNALKNLNAAYPEIEYYRYAPDSAGMLLQGDSWSHLEVVNFESPGSKKEISGIILSNTCDLSIDNKRIVPPKIVFAPIIQAPAYYQWLVCKTKDETRINSYFASIKAQAVTDRFYLPHYSGLNSDYVALLDDVHSIPSNYFLNKPHRKLHIKLSNEGFYLFIIKLSIHFCRLFDGVERQ